MSRLSGVGLRGRVEEALDGGDEVGDGRARGAVRPGGVVADAVDGVVEADGAGFCYAGLESTRVRIGMIEQ